MTLHQYTLLTERCILRQYTMRMQFAKWIIIQFIYLSEFYHLKPLCYSRNDSPRIASIWIKSLVFVLYLAETKYVFYKKAVCPNKIDRRGPRLQPTFWSISFLVGHYLYFYFRDWDWEREQRKCLRSVEFINISVDYYSLSITYLQSIHKNKVLHLFKIKLCPNTEM